MDSKAYKPSVHDRLRSIALDAAYVRSVAAANPSLAVVPNLRCGEWYVSPELAGSRQAYFKSTDGHTGEWDFNLRRANMHLLTLIEQIGGLILIDATRRGKRFPDALSKTIPLWCATINRACVLRRQRTAQTTGSIRLASEAEDLWRAEVIVPSQSVGKSERWDIEQRVDGWAEKLLASSLPLPELALPLRPIHLSPADPLSTLAPPATLGFYPIVCLSASRYIASDAERQMPADVWPDGGEGGEAWRYEQGAGDDHELWSEGLTARSFWRGMPGGWERLAKREVERLARAAVAARSDVDAPADAVENRVSSEAAELEGTVDLVRPTALIHLAALPLSPAIVAKYACIVLSTSARPVNAPRANRDPASPPTTGQDVLPSLQLLVIPSKPPKMTLPSPQALEEAIAFASLAIGQGQRVVVACEGGTDGSVGVGIVLLQALFDDEGRPRSESGVLEPPPSKKTLSTRLQWAITARPRANPSRKTLQHVNQFFLSGAHRPATEKGAGESLVS